MQACLKHLTVLELLPAVPQLLLLIEFLLYYHTREHFFFAFFFAPHRTPFFFYLFTMGSLYKPWNTFSTSGSLCMKLVSRTRGKNTPGGVVLQSAATWQNPIHKQGREHPSRFKSTHRALGSALENALDCAADIAPT